MVLGVVNFLTGRGAGWAYGPGGGAGGGFDAHIYTQILTTFR